MGTPGIAPDAVVGLVLAAGAARRMGRQKLLLPVRGESLAQRAVDLAAAELGRVVIVLGAQAERLRGALRLPEAAIVTVNEGYEEGIASSLARGLAAVPSDAEGALVLLADQPDMPRPAVRAVLGAAAERPEPILGASYDGTPGHPVLIRRQAFPAVMGLRGDAGARALARERPGMVGEVALPGPPPPDVDTPDDYSRATGV